ncbi:MAG: hypothetical protein UT84_C0018G0002 [Candidatus Curtissbacteria bacterium GW2011_GWA1_40_16]|uniref:Uncharacterized protein n=1 Tax=Candidatus Curtissbacteria bacterium GW2011_GWA1_40_16 TaxID=1618405 RepID=A0A0G0RIZ4_9BACT|nr:MAG: hypothetical protein UT84_C0018G0002 [Candidatus Curtissbacteria bacterium GW2011_GWA1_40_16]
MALFSKKDTTKTDEEIKKEGVGSAAVGKVVKVNKIKDLNSQNKRKRKEPVRAWGKFDRIVIFLLIFLTCGLSGYLALASRGYKLPGFPRISFPKNSLFGEKVVEFNSSGQDKIMNKKAVDEINSTIRGRKFSSGIAYEITRDGGNLFRSAKWPTEFRRYLQASG